MWHNITSNPLDSTSCLVSRTVVFITTEHLFGNRDSSDGVVTRLQDVQQTNHSSTTDKGRTGFGFDPDSHLMDTRFSSTGVKAIGAWKWLLTTYSFLVKMSGSILPLPHTPSYGIWEEKRSLPISDLTPTTLIQFLCLPQSYRQTQEYYLWVGHDHF